MKITLDWLRQYVDFDWDVAELVERLTMSGLERETIDDQRERFRGVVVGEVRSCQPHPDADRLRVCSVDVGDSDPAAIVCGAPNVAAGQKVPVILPGHSLPDGTRIARTKIRGVESAGMICSEVELGIGEDASGIIVLPAQTETGAPFASAMGMDDVVVEFEVTPNRPDCLSVVGIAREVRALTGAELRLPEGLAATATGACDVDIEIEDALACPRYVGRVVHGVHVGPSPDWLQRRLRAVGLRPLNNIVDVTNFVMWELGQPLHAFDLSKLAAARVVVRRGRTGERLHLLDGSTCAIDEEILVIADSDKPVALAGIMGGANSEVSANTTDVLLEAAYFNPEVVREGTRRLGVSSNSSARFERGCDWAMPAFASDRAAALLAEVAAGKPAPRRDLFPHPPELKIVTLRTERLNSLLSIQLEPSACRRILELLGCQVREESRNLRVTVPSFRPDLEREADLIEEVGRIYGYDRIGGSDMLCAPLSVAGLSDYEIQRLLRRRCVEAGLDEVITNSIVEGAWLAPLDAGGSVAELANPPTVGQNSLRTSLIPSLADVARRNFNRRARKVAIFELGKCFSGDGSEHLRLSGLWSGLRTLSSWKDDRRQVDFLDIKGAVETIVGDDAVFTSDEHPLLRSGHCASVSIDGKWAGCLGEVLRDFQERFDLPNSMYIFELDFGALATAWRARDETYHALPKFPPIERDLAVLVPKTVPAGEVIAAIRAAEPELIESVDLFDVYSGDQVSAGEKSLAFNLPLRSSLRTLEDREADAVIERILQHLSKTFGARLR